MRGIRRKSSNEKRFLIAFGSIAIGQTFTRIAYFLGDYYVKGYYIGQSYYGNHDQVYPEYNFFVILGYFFTIISFILFLIIFEKKRKYFRKFLILLNCLLLSSSFFFPLNNIRYAFYGLITIDSCYIIAVLLWYSKNSELELQAISNLLIIGYIIFMVGSILDGSYIKKLDVLHPTFSIFLIIMGTIIMYAPMYLNPKYFTRIILNWVIFIFCLSTMVGIAIYFISTSGFSIFTIGVWIIIGVGIYYIKFSLSHLRDIIKNPNVLQIKDGDETILKAFLHPRKISEDEIVISREKQICLICKGILSRNLYLCPNCNAFYCDKCAHALIERENACWVCNTAIDESKPSFTVNDDIIIHNLEKKHKKIVLISIPEEEFLKKVDLFEWEKKEKESFINYMLTLPYDRRNEILNEMIEKTFNSN